MWIDQRENKSKNGKSKLGKGEGGKAKGGKTDPAPTSAKSSLEKVSKHIGHGHGLGHRHGVPASQFLTDYSVLRHLINDSSTSLYPSCQQFLQRRMKIYILD